MAEIKSAFEIAMERVKDVQSDPDSLASHQRRTEGKRLTALLFDKSDNHSDEVFQRLKSADPKERGELLAGAAEVIQSYLRLPGNETDVDAAIEAIRVAGSIAARDVAALTTQIQELLSQYLSQRGELIEHIRQQFTERARQTGRRMRPEQDPEYAKVVQANLGALTDRYHGVVEQLKEEVRTLLEQV